MQVRYAAVSLLTYCLVAMLTGCSTGQMLALRGFSCADGLTQKTATSRSSNIKIDSCIDSAGKKQGPYQVTRISTGLVQTEGTYVDNKREGIVRDYDEDGDLAWTAEYQADELGEIRLTPTTIQKLFTALNKRMRNESKQGQFKVVGDVVRFELTLRQNQVLKLSESDKPDILPLSTACEMLYAARPLVKRIELVAIWPNGVITEFSSFSNQDCVSARVEP